LSLDEPAAEGRSRAGILNFGESIAVEINISYTRLFKIEAAAKRLVMALG
jgi:hypothetical protein